MKKENKITIIYKRPGQLASVEVIPNTLDALQNAVGGYIESFRYFSGAVCFCNEDGKMLGLPDNIWNGLDIVTGAVVVAGSDGEGNLISVPLKEIASTMMTLNRAAVSQEINNV